MSLVDCHLMHFACFLLTGLASPPAKLHLLALGPVGSHAIINAAVTAPDFEIEQTCVLKRLIFPVHLGFEHPL